jgi:hypothetical protein
MNDSKSNQSQPKQVFISFILCHLFCSIPCLLHCSFPAILRYYTTFLSSAFVSFLYFLFFYFLSLFAFHSITFSAFHSSFFCTFFFFFFLQIQKAITESYAEYMAGRSYVYNVAKNLDLASVDSCLDADGK